MEIKDIVASILKERQDKGGLKQIYFVGCGGSLGAFYPAHSFIEHESKTLMTSLISSNDFVHNTPSAFGENAVLVVACHKGNTPETVEAARKAQAAKVPVVALVYFQDTPIDAYCDYLVRYTFGDDKDIADEKVMQGMKIAVEFLHQTEGYAHYDAFYQGVSMIDGIVKHACKHVQRRADAFAVEYKDDPVFYTMGSGAGYGAAYMESICIFMEMQWIHSSSIHSGEFFHGPFEITDVNTPFFLQLSEGKTRALDERALTFLQKYGKRIEILDAKELGLSTIPETVVDYFNHSLFNNVYNVYNHALAAQRQHPLTTRRYMWKVAY